MSLNPFILEKQFATLKQSLELKSSFRLQLLQISEFLDRLGERKDVAFLSAYGKELLPRVAPLIINRDFTGTSPLFIARLEKSLGDVKELLSGVPFDFPWGDVLDALRHEREKITRTLVQRSEAKAGRDPSRPLAPPGSGVLIPVVEHELVTSVQSTRFGSIKSLSVECGFGKDNGKDQLQFGSFIGSGDEGPSRLKAAVDAARSIVKVITGREIRRGLVVRCALGASDIVEGESLGAGLCAEIVVQALKFLDFHERYRVHDSVAITGVIDDHGAMQPVDDDGLRHKIEACTCSPIGTLVVPKEQEKAARAYAKRFVELISPGAAPISIVGISEVSQIFDDRRLTWSRHVSAIGRGARSVWGIRRPIAAVMFLALLLIIAKLQYGPFDKNPTSAVYEGDMLIVRNKEGRIVDRIHVGEMTVRHAIDEDRIWGTSVYAISDLDGDGSNEVVWAEMREEGATIGMTIKCGKGAGLGGIWSQKIGRSLISATKGDTTENSFTVKEIVAGDFAADRHPTVIVRSTSTFYPTLVSQFDGRTGRLIGEYLHSGHLTQMKVLPPDSNDIRKLLFSGMNNALRSACVVVLDPRAISGQSPSTDEYRMAGFGEGSEEYYVLIPATVVGKVFRYKSKMNSAITLTLHGDSAHVVAEVGIRDFHLTAETPFEPLAGEIYLEFDRNMRPLSAETSDEYDLAAEKLVKMHQLSKIPDRAYLNQYLKTLRYWDGAGWRNEPTRNQMYSRAVAGRVSSLNK